MSSVRIEGFLIDDENEEKIAAHGVSYRQIIQILDNVHIVMPNKKGYRGVYLVLGKDNGGACIAVPVERTNDPTVWRPITAWRCKPGERTLLEERGRYYEPRR